MGVSLCFALISLSLQLLCMKLVPVKLFADMRLTLSLRVSVDLFVFILASSMSSNACAYFEEFSMVLQQFGQILYEINLIINQGNQQQQGQNGAQAQVQAQAEAQAQAQAPGG